jgi:hypothetical protein
MCNSYLWQIDIKELQEQRHGIEALLSPESVNALSLEVAGVVERAS